MRPSEDCIQIAMRLETFKPLAYLCQSRTWTVGYGTTIWPDGRRVTDGDHITQGEAEQILRHRFARNGDRILWDVGRALTQGQLDALSLFYDNMPQSRWAGSTILRLLREGNFPAAASEFPKWNKVTIDGHKVASNGLTVRRKLERRIFERG